MAEMALNVEASNHEGVMPQRMVNMYVEPTPNGPDKVRRYPRPGLNTQITIGLGPIRCSFIWKTHRIIVSRSEVYFDGVLIGNITGDDLCRYAISDDEIVITADGKPWYVTSSSVAVFTDPDLLPNIVDVLLSAGRFIYLSGDDTTFQWSALGDARNIDGLSFAEANENSSEVLLAGFVLVDDIVFFMGNTAEWWSPSDDAANPYQRSPGRKYNKGIAARATTVLTDNTVFFLGSDRTVYRAGSVPTRVSNYTVEDATSRMTEADLADSSAFTVTFSGHVFYVLNLPGVGTWALDVGLSKWYEWSSWNRTRFRVTVADSELMGDFFSGAMFTFDKNSFNEVGDPIERVVSSYLAYKSGPALRNFNIYLRCVRGVGLVTGYGATPVVEMRYSDDEGYTYTPWREAPLGIQGDRSDVAKSIWYDLAAVDPPGRLYEYRCTDPVFFSPAAAYFNEVRP